MPEIDTSGLTENLTRKVGPLPLWGWAGVAVGGYAIFKVIGSRGSSGGSTVSTAQDLSTGTTPDLGAGGGASNGGDNTASGDVTLSDIQNELDALSKQIGNSNPGTVKFPPWFETWLKHHKPVPPTPTPKPTHTAINYVVQAGDTWAKIAAAHHMTLAQFFRLNPTLSQTHVHQQRGGGRTIRVWKVA